MEGLTHKKIEDYLCNYDWSSQYIHLDHNYVFTFNIAHIFKTQHSQSHFFDLAQNLTGYFLHFLCNDDDNILIEYSNKMKIAYCQLIETLKKYRKNNHIDILLLLVTLMVKESVKNYLVRLLESNKFNENWQKSKEKENNLQIDSHIFIIMMYQISGTFMSPQAINLVKTKYIEQKIFRPEDIRTNYRLVESLKFIQDNMNKRKQKTTIIERNKGIKTEIQIALAGYLKTNTNEKTKGNKQNGNIYQAEHYLQQIFHQNFDHTTPNNVYPNANSFKGFSQAFKWYYPFQNHDQSIKYKRMYDKGHKNWKAKFKNMSEPENKGTRSKTQMNDDMNTLNNSCLNKNWPQILNKLKKNNEEIKIERYQRAGKNDLETRQKKLSLSQNKTNIDFVQKKGKVQSQHTCGNQKGESSLPQIGKKTKLTLASKFIKANISGSNAIKKKAKVNREGRYFEIRPR